MVAGVLADVNIEAHIDYLMSLVRAAPWGDLWQELGFTYATFAEVGLPREAPDSQIWQCCQDGGYVLITNNRNRLGSDSLEATIRTRNTDQSLPVLTIGDAERLRRSREYADDIAQSLLGFLIDMDAIRGAGRLYLP